MTTTTEGFKPELLGTWSDPLAFEVTRERAIQYAEATNDTIPDHAEGRLAPPVFAVVPAFPVLMPTAAAVTPPEVLMTVVHGEQDFRFHRPIEPGMALQTRAAAVGIRQRSSGVTVVIRAETTAAGEPVVDQYMTAFFRGAQTDASHGEEAPEHGFPEELRSADPAAEVAQTFDADQTYRYAEASGDPMPIHTDEEFARKVGLPGIIIHGLCTMAFCSRVVVEHACPDDPSRLKRLAVRFAKVVQPEQTITTRLYEHGDGTLRFETTADSGDVVIKDGLAEVA